MSLPWIAVYAHPRLVQALVLSVLAALVLSRAGLRPALAAVWDRKTLRWLLVVAALGASLRAAVPPGHRIWDEFTQLNSAQNFARMGAYGESMAGGSADYDLLRPARHWPPMFAVMAQPAFALAGRREGATFALNLLLGTLSVPLLALGAGLLLDDARAGLAAGALFAVFPPHAEHSAAGSLTIASVFWLSAALAACGASARRPEDRALSWLALLCGLGAASCRVENALLLPFIYISRRRIPSFPEILVSSLILFPNYILLRVNMIDEADNYPGLLPVFSNLGVYAWPNFKVLVGRWAGLWVPAFAAPFLVRRSRWALLGWCAAAPLYFLLYSAHSSGGFEAVDGDRLTLNLQTFAFVSAGALVAAGRLGPAGVVAAALALSVPSWRGRPLHPVPQPDITDKAAFAADLAKSLPKGAQLITHSPPLFVTRGVPAVAGHLFVEKSPMVKEMRRRGAAFYLFEDYWWAQRPGESAALLAALDRDYRREPWTTRRIGEIDYPVFKLVPR